MNRPKLVRALQSPEVMRLLGSIAVVASAALAPRLALARPSSHDGPVFHDHRSSSSSSDSGHSAPVVHDHRSSDSAPVVRDHRSSDSAPVVRDHRRDDSGAYVASSEEVVTDDTGSPGPFLDPRGRSWILELGGVAQRFRGPAMTRHGTVETTSGDTASYGLDSGAPAAGDTGGGGFAARFTGPVARHLYAGGELELGGVTRSPIQLMTDSSEIHISARSMFGAAGVLGARARHGIAELDGEIAGGVRVLATTVQSLDAGDNDPSSTESSLTGIVEARLRGALWVSPHVFVAAQAGIGVLDRSDVNVGLSIGLASHVFGE